MTQHNLVADLVRQCLSAFLAGDRRTLDAILSEDFTFTSPRDDRISKTQYFERCFPNSDQFRSLTIDKLFVQGNEAFVRYQAELKDGTRFRNTEYHRVENNQIREVDVYFGASATKDA